MESCAISKSRASKHSFCKFYSIEFSDLPRHVFYYIISFTYLSIALFFLLVIAIGAVDSD